jgi:hypothetical protein
LTKKVFVKVLEYVHLEKGRGRSDRGLAQSQGVMLPDCRGSKCQKIALLLSKKGKGFV